MCLIGTSDESSLWQGCSGRWIPRRYCGDHRVLFLHPVIVQNAALCAVYIEVASHTFGFQIGSSSIRSGWTFRLPCTASLSQLKPAYGVN